MADFVMPVLGADMEDGTLVAWLKHEGERVTRGEIVAEVETQKGLIEVEIFATGVLEKILVAPGTTVPVGTVLAIVREDDGAATEVAAAPPGALTTPAPSPTTPTPPGAAVAPPPPTSTATEAAPPAPVPAPRASPAARALARERHVDLASVAGTGPGGVVERADVERATVAAPRVGRSDEARQHGMRQAIAAAMARSKREIPHYYLASTVDLQAASRWLTEQNASRPVISRLLMAPLFIMAVARALREVPELNGTWRDGGPVLDAAIHVGVGVGLRGGGLVAPCLHDADQQDIPTLMERLRDLVNRARAGRLRSSELSDSTITVTSLGDQGVETVFGVIFPPQLAIVGFGRVLERPWVVDGAIVARPMVDVTLAADHRASDGHRGARFLAAVARLLQQPESL